MEPKFLFSRYSVAHTKTSELADQQIAASRLCRIFPLTAIISMDIIASGIRHDDILIQRTYKKS